MTRPSAADQPTRPPGNPPDIAANSLLHRSMHLLIRLDAWPAWHVATGLALLAAGGGVVWAGVLRQPLTGLLVGLLAAAFIGADGWILYQLPRRRLSFGPWGSQLTLLALPRLLTTVTLGLAAGWLGLPVAGISLVVIQSAAWLALWWGALREPSRVICSELRLTIPYWLATSPPLTILHVADLHTELASCREEQVVAWADSLRPDLILLSGDYVGLSHITDPRTHVVVRQVLGRLADIAGPDRIFATLGTPPVDVRRVVAPLLAEMPLQLLRGAVATVDCGRGRRLQILGLDCTHHLPTDRSGLAGLVARSDPDLFRVLLYHSPELMPEAAAAGLDLYLCGHTHGGQVRLPLIGAIMTSSQLGRRYVMGAYRQGSTQLYVSRGIGFEGLGAPRVRFLAPPEVLAVSVQGERRL